MRKPSYQQPGEIIRPDRPEDAGNEAYTGMLGKRGQVGQNSNKMAGRPSQGVDTSIAHIQGVGANFRAD